jgi:hypothetical protein
MLADLIGGCVVDWKLAIDEERAALTRIVALLFSLADLAESASRRCRLVRSFVLWLLRPAESLAWDFVIGAEPPAALISIGPAGDSRADAMRLAESFHDLACELECQASLAFAIQDGAGQVGPPSFGAYRTLDADDFLNTLRSVVANIACRAAGATHQPDTS